jgi:hypothetical protein
LSISRERRVTDRLDLGSVIWITFEESGMKQHLVVNQDKNPARRSCVPFKSKEEDKKVEMTHVAKLQKLEWKKK